MRLTQMFSNSGTRRTLGALALVGGAAAFAVSVAHADGIPTSDPLFYSGVVDDGGVLVEGTRAVQVDLYDAVTGGNQRCSTDAGTTSFTAGRFRVPLSGGCLTAVQTYPNLYVEVSVGGTTMPRTKLGAVPYAVEAGRAALADVATDADALGGLAANQFAANAHTHAGADVSSGSLAVAQLPAGVPHNCEEVVTTDGAGDTKAVCPGAKKVFGGGSVCAPSGDQGDAEPNTVKYSRPEDSRTSWRTICSVTDGSKGAWAHAICCDE